MVGTCKLCHEPAQIRYSHIIPELCHKGLYDDKHRAIPFGAGEIQKGRYIQKGLRDWLLCDECEGKLSRIETAFDKCWYQRPVLPRRVPAEGVEIRGFDYAGFKIFHLSILWRAGVSQRREFGAVSLGPYEEKLRTMILERDPGTPEEFPLIGQVLVDPEDDYRVVFGLVSVPQRSRLDASYAYLTCYAGVEWVCFITDHPSPRLRALDRCLPQRNGTMVLRVRDYRVSNTVKGILAGRRRRY